MKTLKFEFNGVSGMAATKYPSPIVIDANKKDKVTSQIGAAITVLFTFMLNYTMKKCVLTVIADSGKKVYINFGSDKKKITFELLKALPYLIFDKGNRLLDIQSKCKSLILLSIAQTFRYKVGEISCNEFLTAIESIESVKNAERKIQNFAVKSAVLTDSDIKLLQTAKDLNKPVKLLAAPVSTAKELNKKTRQKRQAKNKPTDKTTKVNPIEKAQIEEIKN